MPETTASSPRVQSLPTTPERLSCAWLRSNSGVNSLKPGRAGPPRGDDVEVGLAQARLHRVDVDVLQELRLQQFADPGDLAARLGGVDVRQEAVRAGVAGVEAQRLGRLVDAELLEAEVVVDAGEAGAARRPVLVEQLARAVDGAVVVQLDRLLQVAQRLDRPVLALQADGVVEPGRRVVRVELLGYRELLGGERVLLVREVRRPAPGSR